MRNAFRHLIKPLSLLLFALTVVWTALTIGGDVGTVQEFQPPSGADATQTQSTNYKSSSQLSMPAMRIPPGYSSEIIQVRFREGTDVNPPETTLPSDLRNSVTSMTRLFSLPEEKLAKIGAGRFKLWFQITLKPGTDAADFLEKLKQVDSVEVAEPAPLPAPPPVP